MSKKLNNKIERLTKLLNHLVRLSDTGTAEHAAAFDPKGTRKSKTPGWRVVEEMRAQICDALEEEKRLDRG